MPTAPRKNSSFLLGNSDETLLIDCSGSPLYEFHKLGFSMKSLKYVYLTHSHVDHVYALPSLLHCWSASKERGQEPLNIVGTEQTLEIARALTAVFGLEDVARFIGVTWNALNLSEPRNVPGPDGGFLTAWRVTHKDQDAMALQIGATLFGGDAEWDELLSRALGGVETAVLDCGGGLEGTLGHAGAIEIAEGTRRLPHLRRIYLNHISGDFRDDQSLIDVFVDASAEVGILRDGSQFELSWGRQIDNK